MPLNFYYLRRKSLNENNNNNDDEKTKHTPKWKTLTISTGTGAAQEDAGTHTVPNEHHTYTPHSRRHSFFHAPARSFYSYFPLPPLPDQALICESLTAKEKKKGGWGDPEVAERGRRRWRKAGRRRSPANQSQRDWWLRRVCSPGGRRRSRLGTRHPAHRPGVFGARPVSLAPARSPARAQGPATPGAGAAPQGRLGQGCRSGRAGRAARLVPRARARDAVLQAHSGTPAPVPAQPAAAADRAPRREPPGRAQPAPAARRPLRPLVGSARGPRGAPAGPGAPYRQPVPPHRAPPPPPSLPPARPGGRRGRAR